MSDQHHQLTQLLKDNRHVNLAYLKYPDNAPELNIHTTQSLPEAGCVIPRQLCRTTVQYHHGPSFKTLICPAPVCLSDHPNQRCQDEPVKLGTQIHPGGAGWVGTAGAPVSWRDKQNRRLFGILSNWHVMAAGRYDSGHPQHQPTDRYPQLGYLERYTEISSRNVNHHDSALADCLVNDFHTISDQLLNIGALNPIPVHADVGLRVSKSGRTTGLTHGQCSATGASVRVDYGNFTALFQDQDVFQDVAGNFSAGGDSGSLICSTTQHKPCALLFAGGGNLTIGSPIRYVVQAYSLRFHFN